MDEVIEILLRHEQMWLDRMNEPAKRGGLKDNATACLYRKSAIEDVRREIEALSQRGGA